MKGIILAGGSGTRLRPVTIGVSKQLLPVYDKPMIYYPLSVLMMSGIREILIITSPADKDVFGKILGDGSSLGLSITYAEQTVPRGLADAFLVGAEHVGTDSVALVLGDNIFHGPDLGPLLRHHVRDLDGCTLFGHPVRDPERYGVGETDSRGRLVSLTEKPEQPSSNKAVTGLYLYDNDVVEVARQLRPSPRGELEITDVNRTYMEEGRAKLVELGNEFSWFDTGTCDSLLEASKYVQEIESRQGTRIACIEEIAYSMGFVSAEELHELGARLSSSPYGNYVKGLVEPRPLLEVAG
ncbi:glucose-1-phosphate thymidylyltransferase RfbA [Actinopolyspora mortivallis]|uniref:Glucose-1-phosphate thymidylyltransferase n=1 Tax=Actinopolyspora mortivallis TaxID=33906 RepID=A0A2T0GSG4_ACTMO|nr:glucose-1-phosphate thymidylyltransferase RfbA [Actinopolyspora mortivallis]PRW61983.1 glucose-1-phosphate thymidylyltransferase [Actinopolyspora mortivallis]